VTVSTVRTAGCLVGTLLLMSTACSIGQHQAADVQKLQARAAFERGVKHIEARQASHALAALREAVALDPTSAVYRDMLGLVYSQLQRPDLAMQEFREATTIDPQFADAHFHLGVALAESTRWGEAAAAYRRALALPTLTVPDLAHQNLGLALYHLRQYPDAERELRFAINLTPDMQAPYFHLGLVLAAQGRAEEARLAFAHARTLGPATPFGEAAGQRLKALGGGTPGP
jgi:Tfp pilus assembly protein PilF